MTIKDKIYNKIILKYEIIILGICNKVDIDEIDCELTYYESESNRFHIHLNIVEELYYI